MKYLLIPTDFSANSWNALEYAVRFFKNESCTIYILHVGDLSESDVMGNSFTLPSKKTSPAINEKLHALFGQIKQLPINKNHHFIALQEYGNFIDTIRKTVREKHIDLIVMGTKGASGIKASIVGSNTGDVITKVLCNVLVIPEKALASTPHKISFPTDYNLFYTHSILEGLTEILQISKAHLHVLNVGQGKGEPTGAQQKNKSYLQDYLSETFPEKHSFHQISDRHIRTGILRFAEENQIEMLAMVAKNLNFLQQLLFDTTIEKVSFHTKIPLWVLHE